MNAAEPDPVEARSALIRQAATTITADPQAGGAVGSVAVGLAAAALVDAGWTPLGYADALAGERVREALAEIDRIVTEANALIERGRGYGGSYGAAMIRDAERDISRAERIRRHLRNP